MAKNDTNKDLKLEDLFLEALSAYNEDDYEKSLDKINLVINQNEQQDNNIIYLELKAKNFIMLEKYDEALAEITQALNVNRYYLNFQAIKIYILLAIKEFKRAENVLKEILGFDKTIAYELNEDNKIENYIFESKQDMVKYLWNLIVDIIDKHLHDDLVGDFYYLFGEYREAAEKYKNLLIHLEKDELDFRRIEKRLKECLNASSKNFFNESIRKLDTKQFEQRLENRRSIGASIKPYFNSEIHYSRIDSKGNTLDEFQFYQMRKMIQTQKILSREREVELELVEDLKNAGNFLPLPIYQIKTAIEILKEMQYQKVLEEEPLEVILSVCLYAAVRAEEGMVLLEDICDLLKANKKIVKNHVRGIVREKIFKNLGLKYNKLKPNKLISLFGNRLGLAPKYHSKALEVLKETINRKMIFKERNPKVQAIAALYLTIMKSPSIEDKDEFTQERCASIAKISEPTLRSNVKEMTKVLGLESNKYF